MERTNIAKVHLENQTLEENIKDFEEKSYIEHKANISYGLGKRKVTIVSEEDLNPSLTEVEKKAQAAIDKELDALKAIKEELDMKDVDKKNAKEIDAMKMALFSKWTFSRM